MEPRRPAGREEIMRGARVPASRSGEISSERVGIVMGSGGGSPKDQLESFDVMRERGIRRVGPLGRIPRVYLLHRLGDPLDGRPPEAIIGIGHVTS